MGPPPAWGWSAPVPLGGEHPTPVSPAAVGAAVGWRHLTRQGLVCSEGTAHFTLSQASLRVQELHVREVILSSPRFYEQDAIALPILRTRSLRLSKNNLSVVTQLISGEARIRTLKGRWGNHHRAVP